MTAVKLHCFPKHFLAAALHPFSFPNQTEILCSLNMIFFPSPSELDQSNATEENPEGEEHPPADTENK